MRLKTLSIFALFSALIVLAGCSDTSVPKQGEHYQPLPADLSQYDLAPVTKVFSLTCGHCRSMESMIPQLEELVKQPVGKVHVTFNESARIGAMIYYTAEMQLGKVPNHQMMEDLFATVQMDQGASLQQRQEAIESVFKKNQLVSPYQLDKAQQSQLFEIMETAQEVSVKGQINSVPTFIVKGKYRILTSGHNSIESMANTINYLLAQP